MDNNVSEPPDKPSLGWDYSDKSEHFDPLLECLIIVTRLLNKPYSKQSLIAGLPLEENCLNPDTLLRAAEKGMLAGKIVKKTLQQISSLSLPAILLMHNKQACVLTDVNDPQMIEIILPESGEGKVLVERALFEQDYSGFVIFLTPKFQFSDHSRKTLDDKPRDWFWDIIKLAWPIYTEVLVASFLINLFAIASPLFIMNVYDRVVPNQAFDTLWVLAIGVGIIFIFDFILRTIRGYYIDVAGKGLDIHMSALIHEQLLASRMAVRPKSVGVLANMVYSFESFRDFMTSSTISLLIDVPFIFLFIIAIYLISGDLALVSIISIPIVLLVSLMIEIPLSRKIIEMYRYSSEKQAALIESLSVAETIKFMTAESTVQGKWEQIIKNLADIGIKVRFLSNVGVNFSMFAQYLASIIVVLWGVYKISNAQLTMGGLIATTILTGRALAPMTQIASLCSRYFQSEVALKAIDKVMKTETDRTKGKTYLHRPTLKGAVEFQNVIFRYRSSPLIILDRCSFKINPGEKVGIIGRVGSGKSTIGRLILNLYSIESGHIFFDDTDLAQIDPAELRQNIGYVPQDVALFNGSVRENIIYGAPYVDDARILRALQLSGVESFVKTHPEGIDMQVGERGSEISGGQKQSIAIARALLLDPPILFFDEPTSAMDDRTENILRTNLQETFKEKTLILVTQRASTLSLVDRLIILDNGRVIADGPKEQVIAALAEAKIKVR